MGAYAQYLDTRIRVFRDIKHDLVRVQTESNRRSDGLGAGCEPPVLASRLIGYFARPRRDAEALADQVTAKARRLRHLPVEKGLLREVKAIQRILDSLVQCRVCASNPSSSLVLTEQFFEDDMRDENTVLAFRMLIKDLLVLFQAGNEGVCNILGESLVFGLVSSSLRSGPPLHRHDRITAIVDLRFLTRDPPLLYSQVTR